MSNDDWTERVSVLPSWLPESRGQSSGTGVPEPDTCCDQKISSFLTKPCRYPHDGPPLLQPSCDAYRSIVSHFLFCVRSGVCMSAGTVTSSVGAPSGPQSWAMGLPPSGQVG